jgi:hypothetical protein
LIPTWPSAGRPELAARSGVKFEALVGARRPARARKLGSAPRRRVDGRLVVVGEEDDDLLAARLDDLVHGLSSPPMTCRSRGPGDRAERAAVLQLVQVSSDTYSRCERRLGVEVPIRNRRLQVLQRRRANLPGSPFDLLEGSGTLADSTEAPGQRVVTAAPRSCR